jgi:hypothetical protein
VRLGAPVRTVRRSVDFAYARAYFGLMLRMQGRYLEALAEFKHANEPNLENTQLRSRFGYSLVRQTKQMIELDPKLPAILIGQDKPPNPAESLVLAQMCYDKKVHGASSRLWAEAFQARSSLTTCVPRTATTPPAPRPLPDREKGRTTRHLTTRLKRDGASRRLNGSRPT